MEAIGDFGCWPGLFAAEDAEDLQVRQRKNRHGSMAQVVSGIATKPVGHPKCCPLLKHVVLSGGAQDKGGARAAAR